MFSAAVPAPSFISSKPTVTTRLVEFPGVLGSYTRTHFVCDFETSVEDETLFYEVHWTINGMENGELLFQTHRYRAANISKLEITEEIFVNDYKLHMGIQVCCLIRINLVKVEYIVKGGGGYNCIDFIPAPSEKEFGVQESKQEVTNVVSLVKYGDKTAKCIRSP